MLKFTRRRADRKREQRLADELLEQLERNRQLEADRDRVLGEGRQVAEIAKECAGFGPAMRDLADACNVLRRDCDALEAQTGLMRPSRIPPPADVAALWRSLPY